MIKFELKTDKLMKRFKRIQRNVDKEQKIYLRKTGTFIKDKIAKNTPKDTGLAKNSWKLKIRKNTAIIANFARTKKNGRNYYLQFVNNGTKYISPRRFVEKTIKRYEPVIKKQKQKFLKNILK